MIGTVRRIAQFTLAFVVALVTVATGFLYWQGSRPVDNTGDYVALGSSFAAGFGLGPTAEGSPIQCFRGSGGYPSLVARRAGLRLVDMSCSGSTTEHILNGGQMLLGPQLAAIGPETKLVTITAGGNDVGYVSDLMAASGSVIGWWRGELRPAADRPYARVGANLQSIVRHIRSIAPDAQIMIISYPVIVPENGDCAKLGMPSAQADVGRTVARLLARATELAARDSDVLYIDMAAASVGHHACSAVPWVNGSVGEDGQPFHPTAAGADAVASRVISAMRQ